MRKQREEEDFCDEHEDFQLESSSDESRFDKSSLDGKSADEENLEVDNGRGDNTQGLGDNDGGVQLEDENSIFRPFWKDNAGGYLQGVRRCSSSTTRKCERRRKKELEKSTSTTRSIVDIFSAQSNKILSTPSPAVPSSKSSKGKVKETRHELQTQAAQDLGELLRLKTVRMN